MKEIAQIIAEKGAGYCKNPDLLSLLFGKLDKETTKILNQYINSGDTIKQDSLPKFIRAKVLAFTELSQRFLKLDREVITHSRDIAKLCSDMAELQQEHFVMLTLDGANAVIAKRIVFIGTLNKSLVHPREIFVNAIHDRAAAIVIVHNHPSGNLMPSAEDFEITQNLLKAAGIIGIDIVDHVIITNNGHYSFHGNGKI